MPGSKKNDINSYKTFTSLFLTVNSNDYYFLTSRSDLTSNSDQGINISLATLVSKDYKPIYFLSDKTKCSEVSKTKEKNVIKEDINYEILLLSKKLLLRLY